MHRLRRAVLLCGVLAGLPVVAQVGVETGLTGAGHAGAIGPVRRLGSAVSRSVFGSAAAVPVAHPPVVPPPVRAVASPGTSAGGWSSRLFVPREARSYVAGVAWEHAAPTPALLKVGAQEVRGTTDTPLLLHFSAGAGAPLEVSARPEGAPLASVLGSLDLVREARAGETASKSLLTPEERAADALMCGPRPSLLPLLANLAQRHLERAAPQNDLDRLFIDALAAARPVTEGDLRTLVSRYDALPAAVRTKAFSPQTAALRSAAAPTLAQISALLVGRRDTSGFSGGLTNAAPRLLGLSPALPPEGAYAPGARLRLVGENFGARADDNCVHLGPDLRRLLSTPPLPVLSSSPTALDIMLPQDLQEGTFYLLVNVNYKHATSAFRFQVANDGLRPGVPDATPAGLPPASYRLSCLRLECVDESNPEWWGEDEVVLLLDAVADDRASTRFVVPPGPFSDGTMLALPEEGRVLLPEAAVSKGLGVVARVWRWNRPLTAEEPGEWALREAFANMLAGPQPAFADPAPQDDVSGELAVQADLLGEQQLTLSAEQLARSLQPGQQQEVVLDLQQGGIRAQSDASGHYRLYLLVERTR